MPLLDTDPTSRTAGQYARATVRRLRMRALVALGVLAVPTALLGRTFGWHDVRFLGAEVGLLVGMFVISRYVLPLVEQRDRGARAEEQVGRLLEDLPRERWEVIHDATLGRGNVDHIVLGPAGVFTVETKSHPGPIKIGRLHGKMLAQAQAEGKAIGWVTGVEAQPLIVFSRAWVDRPGGRRKGVRVLPARMLVGFLERLPETLSRNDVREAHRLLIEALMEQQGRSGSTTRHLGERWGLLR
jgi:Nuclease-related domain